MTDQPTVFKHQAPPEPDGVTRVRPAEWGDGEWRRDGDAWVRNGYRRTWDELMSLYYPRGVEAVDG